jgi:hypothetical protein
MKSTWRRLSGDRYFCFFLGPRKRSYFEMRKKRANEKYLEKVVSFFLDGLM